MVGFMEAMPNPGYKFAVGDTQGRRLQANIDLKPWGGLPWLSRKGGRSIAGRVDYDPATGEVEKRAPPCKNIQYSDTYYWVDEESVYVLKGSKEAHQALEDYYNSPEPKQDYLEFFKSIGAKFYADCKSHARAIKCNLY
jgi:hypothetical protein